MSGVAVWSGDVTRTWRVPPATTTTTRSPPASPSLQSSVVVELRHHTVTGTRVVIVDGQPIETTLGTSSIFQTLSQSFFGSSSSSSSPYSSSPSSSSAGGDGSSSPTSSRTCCIDFTLPDGMGAAWSNSSYHVGGKHVMGESAVRLGVKMGAAQNALSAPRPVAKSF